MASSVGGRSGESRLGDAVRASDLPVALVDLKSQRVVAMSPGAARVFELDPDEVAGRNVFELVDEPERSRAALMLLVSGGVDAYETRRRVRRTDGTTIDGHQWVRRLELDGYTDQALVLLSGYPVESGRVDRPRADAGVIDLTVGTTDAHGQIDRMSPDVEALLGYPNVHFVGTGLASLALSEDVKAFRDAIDRAILDRASVELRVHAHHADGSEREVRVVVCVDSDESPPRLGFSVAGVPGRSLEQRAADLEGALRRIADEMGAVGIVPAMARLPSGASVPELADLPTRQWEIVTRLLGGDRVPAIARAMFLSPNTVRNHLAAVYKKLGVHSQQELIDRLRGGEDGLSRDT